MIAYVDHSDGRKVRYKYVKSVQRIKLTGLIRIVGICPNCGQSYDKELKMSDSFTVVEGLDPHDVSPQCDHTYMEAV